VHLLVRETGSMPLTKIAQILKRRDTTAMFESMQDERNRRKAPTLCKKQETQRVGHPESSSNLKVRHHQPE
jgi:hypothetical protein